MAYGDKLDWVIDNLGNIVPQFRGASLPPNSGNLILPSGSSGASFPLLAPDGSVSAPSYSFASEKNSGMYRNSAGQFGFSVTGVGAAGYNGPSQFLMSSSLVLAWEPGSLFVSAADIGLARNAVGVLEVNNGTAGVFRDFIGRNISSQSTPISPTGNATSSTQLGAQFIYFIDAGRTANNREVEFGWTGGNFTGRFVNDLYNSAINWLAVSGGQAIGVTSILFGGTSATVFGVNGAAGQAQKTGFGTPTGGGVIANFPGATATLAQCSQAIAQLILDLKALGFYGA